MAPHELLIADNLRQDLFCFAYFSGFIYFSNALFQITYMLAHWAKPRQMFGLYFNRISKAWWCFETIE